MVLLEDRATFFADDKYAAPFHVRYGVPTPLHATYSWEDSLPFADVPEERAAVDMLRMISPE